MRAAAAGKLGPSAPDFVDREKGVCYGCETLHKHRQRDGRAR